MLSVSSNLIWCLCSKLIMFLYEASCNIDGAMPVKTENFYHFGFAPIVLLWWSNSCFFRMVKLFVFVSSWWQHSANLASYEQQDAHEFFISMLDAIHEKDGKSRNGSKGNEILIWSFLTVLRSQCNCGIIVAGIIMIYFV